jgi:hypothetical protein
MPLADVKKVAALRHSIGHVRLSDADGTGPVMDAQLDMVQEL